jgi:sulfur carrier protein ThiS adenylyltransferase
MTRSEVPARASRQEGLAPYERLRATHAVVVGVGAVGRQVALQLAAMGVRSLDLYDFDTVDDVNLGPQAYRPADLGRKKVNVTLEDCKALNPDVGLNLFDRRFARSDFRTVANAHVFATVDSIDTRRLIWETAVKGGAAWFGDARVAGENIRVLAQDKPAADGGYAGTLFRQEDAFEGACTARMSVYGANVAAGLLVAKFAQRLRGAYGPPFTDHTLQLFAWDLYEEGV